MKVILPILVSLVILAYSSSCSYFNKSEGKEQPVARVYDNILYKSDLTGVGAGAARPEDSVQAVRNYVDTWIRHNLILRYAQDNLPDEEQALDKQLRDYKESLLIFLYEKELLNDKLDTVVTDPQILQYYNDHREIFELKQGISQVRYIMLKMTTRVQVDSVRSWLREVTPDNYPQIRGFCSDYAVRYSVNDSNWYNNDELSALLPVHKFNLENAQYNKSYLEVADSGYGYLIKFEDYKIKGADAPIDFVRDEIINILVNKRKLAFLGSIHKNIYDEALVKNNFEVFINTDSSSNK